MDPSPRLRTLAMLVFALAACGPQESSPAAPPAAEPSAAAAPLAPAAASPPVECAVDDETVLAAVYARARPGDGAPFPKDWTTLPPRVSLARVAVRALHDHLLELTTAPADFARLVDALGELSAACPRATDSQALAAFVAAWRTWTPAQRAAEKELAIRVTRSLDLVRGAGEYRKDAVAAAFAGAPKDVPPMSPGGANLAGLRAVHLALTLPGDDWPSQLARAVEGAGAAFSALHWRGGAGVWFEIAAARLERAATKPSFRATAMTEAARGAFEGGGDRVRVGLLLADRAAAVRRSGDVARAVKLAELALLQLTGASCRGRETSDLLFEQAEMFQQLGRHEEALAALDLCLAEVRYAGTDPAQVAPVEERRATSLFLLGRYDEAVAAADSGSAAYEANVAEGNPAQERLRASLDQVAGESLAESGRGTEGALRHTAAATRLGRIEGAGAEAFHARLLAARAVLRGGDGAGALAAVKAELSRAAPSAELRAFAASILRDAGDLVAARQHFERARADAETAVREALAEEEARLLAAEGDVAGARLAYERAEKRLAPDPRQAGGPAAARVALDRAKFEEKAGEFAVAAACADRAIFHLTALPVPPSLDVDRAREVYVRCQRRRLRFGDAAAVAKMRLDAGPPGGAARKLDAEMDFFAATLGRARGDADGEMVAAALAAAGRISDPEAARFARSIVERRQAESREPNTRRPQRVNAWHHAAVTLQVDRAISEALRGDVEILRWIARPGGGLTAPELADVRNGEPLADAPAALPDVPVVFLDASEQTLTDLDAAALAAFVEVDADQAARALRTLLSNLASGGGVTSPGKPGVVVLVGAADRTPLPIDLAASAHEPSAADAATYAFARSTAELARCAERKPPAALSLLDVHDAPLRERHAIVKAGICDPSWDAKVVLWTNEQRALGLPAPKALRAAKVRIRAEWKAAEGEKGLPPWACYQLRGAP